MHVYVFDFVRIIFYLHGGHVSAIETTAVGPSSQYALRLRIVAPPSIVLGAA